MLSVTFNLFMVNFNTLKTSNATKIAVFYDFSIDHDYDDDGV